MGARGLRRVQHLVQGLEQWRVGADAHGSLDVLDHLAHPLTSLRAPATTAGEALMHDARAVDGPVFRGVHVLVVILGQHAAVKRLFRLGQCSLVAAGCTVECFHGLGALRRGVFHCGLERSLPSAVDALLHSIGHHALAVVQDLVHRGLRVVVALEQLDDARGRVIRALGRRARLGLQHLNAQTVRQVLVAVKSPQREAGAILVQRAFGDAALQRAAHLPPAARAGRRGRRSALGGALLEIEQAFVDLRQAEV